MQLLAIETTTVYETGPTFWMKTGDAESVHVDLIRPDTANWGYDVVIWGMGTMDRVHLEHGRPDELADFAVRFKISSIKPKMLILDAVLGHSYNQGLDALKFRFRLGSRRRRAGFQMVGFQQATDAAR